MNTSVVNVKVNSEIKKKAQQVAEELGFSLSGLINGYLRQLIKTKTVHFSVSEEPSDYFIKSMKEAKEDIKAGRIISFENWEEEEKYLNQLIENDKKHKSS